MSIIDRIKELNDEITFGADMEAKMRRYVKREKGSEHGQIVQLQLDEVTRRLDRAEREKAALLREAHEAINRRDEIPALRRRNVTFHGIEAVA